MKRFLLLLAICFASNLKASENSLPRFVDATVSDCSIVATALVKDKASSPELEVKITNTSKETLVFGVSPNQVQYIFQLEMYDNTLNRFVPVPVQRDMPARGKISGIILMVGKTHTEKIALDTILPKLDDGKYKITIGRIIGIPDHLIVGDSHIPKTAKAEPVEFSIQSK